MQMVNQLMEDGDSEPPQLPSSPVLRMIKHQTLAADRLHLDPVKALQILKAREMKNEIFTIRCDPFYINYSTELQQKIHRRIANKGNFSLKIDATSGITRTFRRIDTHHTGPIHLFSAVTQTPSGQQIALGQMLTESQAATSIDEWLTEWLGTQKLPFPKEVVTDEGLGLLVGCIRAFTGYKTVNSYADALFDISDTNRLPACYIRLDVAHFLKTYVAMLKNSNKSLGKYYKGGIAKLIMARNKENAEIILRNLLIIAQSPTCGMTVEGFPSLCSHAKEKMEKIFTHHNFENLTFPSNRTETDAEVSTSPNARSKAVQPSLWKDWALEINGKILEQIECVAGTITNELYCPDFSKKLLSDIKWLPLWSCICRDEFGFGRVPASSAAVESSFNIIKTWLLAKMKSPRPDLFITLHKHYLDAQSILVGTKMDNHIKGRDESENRDLQFEVAEISHEQQTEEIGSDLTGDEGGLPGEQPIYHSSPVSSDNRGNFNVEECLICAAGHLPTGGHKCEKCNLPVHIIPPCSVSIGDEEGYGEKRLCNGCNSKREKATTRLCRDGQETGDSKTVSGKRNFSYLKKTYPPDFFTPKKTLDTIPVLKKGNDPSLRAIRVRGKRINLTNTDIFDALFHALLTMAFDLPDFIQYLEQHRNHNALFRMIHYVYTSKRISQTTYVKRYHVLAPHLFNETLGHHEVDCVVMNCESDAGEICEKLMESLSLLERTVICDGGCSPITLQPCVLKVYLDKLIRLNSDFLPLQEDIEEVQTIKCPHSCSRDASSTIAIKAPLILIQTILSSANQQQKIKLHQIPKQVNVLNMEKQLFLRGIVDSEALEDSPVAIRSQRLIKFINGKCSAHVLRNNSWFTIQGGEKTRLCRADKTVLPVLVIYSQGGKDEK
ncbi:uncharacterized protein [Fopius arisanus]|uniref:SCAN domain-containing protein n=1 Tax=Fopius arisanus TaxID=64838 RepID=A0A9R1U870_9HYME|nr:PREDICTED: uncharacterized protein LOC105272230 [Fopius arisanus]